MATRTRSSVSAAVQYEDITPKTEWKEEDRANILLIHAPDFVKEQLKITSVHSIRTIRVTGERKVASNRGIRFDQTFPVPQNCDVQNIQAKFVNGTLTITIPKSPITEDTPPKPDPKSTTATQDAVPPPKPGASTTPTPPVLPQNATTEPKEQKGVEEKGKAAATLQKAPTLRELMKDSKPQNGREDQAILRSPSPSKLDDTALLKRKDENVVKGKKEASFGGDQKSLPEQDQEEIGKQRKESSHAPPEGDKESVKKRKESSIVGGEERSRSSSVKETLLEKERPSIYKDDSVGGKVKNVAAAAKDKMRGFAMEMREDRQKMVNIGVAVLVIAAVGAYLYYRYKSPGNAQED